MSMDPYYEGPARGAPNCTCCGAAGVMLLRVPGSGLLCGPCYQRTYPADALQMRFESLRAQVGALEDRVRELERKAFLVK